MEEKSSGKIYKKIKNYVKDIKYGYLDKSAPAGLYSGGRADYPDDINDAWRHFSAAALSSQLLGPDLTFSIGDHGERSTDDPLRKQMDLNNNDAGIRAARLTQDRFELGMEFVQQVLEGRILIISGKDENRSVRKAKISDLPDYRDGDRVEDRYIPNPKTNLEA